MEIASIKSYTSKEKGSLIKRNPRKKAEIKIKVGRIKTLKKKQENLSDEHIDKYA